MPAKRLGNKLRKMRRRLHVTQKEVARKIGISSRQLRDFESGRAIPDLDTLDAIIEVCHGDREKTYDLYLPLLRTPDACADFVLRCWELGFVNLGIQGAKRLFLITNPTKMEVESIDLLVFFLDK